MFINENLPSLKGTTGRLRALEDPSSGSLGDLGGPKGHIGALSDAHVRMLLEGSRISGEVLAENDVRTISHGRELPRSFSCRQRKRAPGVLFKVPRRASRGRAPTSGVPGSQWMRGVAKGKGPHADQSRGPQNHNLEEF